MLNLSPRRLRRKLAGSGTIYQGVLDSVRLTVASRLIQEADTPIAAIGYELGFVHPSGFDRAFKKWRGQPPSAYRQHG
jgi:AraC-like DNA-binding protein